MLINKIDGQQKAPNSDKSKIGTAFKNSCSKNL